MAVLCIKIIPYATFNVLCRQFLKRFIFQKNNNQNN